MAEGQPPQMISLGIDPLQDLNHDPLDAFEVTLCERKGVVAGDVSDLGGTGRQDGAKGWLCR